MIKLLILTLVLTAATACSTWQQDVTYINRMQGDCTVKAELFQHHHKGSILIVALGTNAETDPLHAINYQYGYLIDCTRPLRIPVTAATLNDSLQQHWGVYVADGIDYGIGEDK